MRRDEYDPPELQPLRFRIFLLGIAILVAALWVFFPSHATSEPLEQGGQWRVNCATVDGGSPTELLVPMDGGVAGQPARGVDSIYVAPAAGSAVKVRVGFGTASNLSRISGPLTASTGFEVGTSARDGVGVSIDTRTNGSPTCISEGAAQQVDVVAGSLTGHR